MNEGQSLASDALRRAIVRISVSELVMSLTLLGLAIFMAVGLYDDRTYFTVTGVVVGAATLLALFEPVIAGVSRQQISELRPLMRPRWFNVVFFSMFAVYVIVSFPVFAKAIGFQANGMAALLTIIGINVFSVSAFNLVKASRSNPGKSILDFSDEQG